MEIILLRDLEKVGDKFEIVNVKDGFGRNYLIPKGYAVIANKDNLVKLDEYKSKEQEKLDAKLSEFQAIAEKLKDQVLRIGAKSGTSGKIFGSVTNVQIAAALKEQFDLDIERRKIHIPEEVKVLGTYVAELELHPDVETKVNFEVVAE